jgi:hypothetical protein
MTALSQESPARVPSQNTPRQSDQTSDNGCGFVNGCGFTSSDSLAGADRGYTWRVEVEEAALAPGCARFVPAASIEADQMIGAGLGRAHCGNDW